MDTDPNYSKPMQGSRESIEQQNSEWCDPQFEENVELYLQTLVNEEQKEFHSELESFEVHAAKLYRQQADVLHQFITSFRMGFQLVTNILKQQQISIPELPEKNMKAIDDTEANIKELSEGKQLYELLGFSSETIDMFYKAAEQLITEREFKNGVDAFYFLTILGPRVARFWHGLAICYKEVGQLDLALETALQAIALDPKNCNSYVLAIELYRQNGDAANAHELCQHGLQLASEQSHETWAQTLLDTLGRVQEQ